MAKDLTARQRQVLEAIRHYVRENGYPPSIRELGKLLEIRSLRGVTVHLDALQRKGWIHRESTSRSIRILAGPSGGPVGMPPVYIPMLGKIAAGIPLLAVENVECYVPVPPEIASKGRELFALRVSSDSMIGDHVLEGDTIVVKNQGRAEHGDVVAALIGGEAVVKRLDLRSKPPRLLASNPSYEPIELVEDGAKILGPVIGLIRTYDTT